MDLQRATLGYKTAYNGLKYHLVQESDGFKIYPNQREVQTPTDSISLSKIKSFDKILPRRDKDVIQELNDSRFLTIEKSPSMLSNVRRVRQESFAK